jgi:hypothetical protein
MQFSFDQEDRARPVIEVQWNADGDGERAQSLNAYTVRIPPSRAGAQRGMDLRQRWVEEISRPSLEAGGVGLTGTEREIDRALMALARNLHRHLHDSDVLWDVVGHSIAMAIRPASHGDADMGSTK